MAQQPAPTQPDDADVVDPQQPAATRKAGFKLNVDKDGVLIDSQGGSVNAFNVIQDADGTFRISVTFKFD